MLALSPGNSPRAESTTVRRASGAYGRTHGCQLPDSHSRASFSQQKTRVCCFAPRGPGSHCLLFRALVRSRDSEKDEAPAHLQEVLELRAPPAARRLTGAASKPAPPRCLERGTSMSREQA